MELGAATELEAAAVELEELAAGAAAAAAAAAVEAEGGALAKAAAAAVGRINAPVFRLDDPDDILANSACAATWSAASCFSIWPSCASF